MENKKINHVVVIKDERTDFLWKEEFESIYEQLNNNININKLSFLDLKKENEQLSLKSGDNPVKLEEIKDSTVLFLTDGAFNLKSFLVQDMLTKLSNDNMVSVVNVMPETKWRSLATGTTEVEATITAHSQNNQQIQTTYQWYHEDEDVNPKDIYLTIPMIPATTDKIDKLLNTMTEGGKIDGILIPTVDEYINYVKNPVDLKVSYGVTEKVQTVEQIAAEKLAKFRHISSPESYTLAILLTMVDNFTINDMKIVQKNLIPESNNSHIAELYLGGILQNLEKDQPKTINTKFAFQEGIAKELFRSLRYSEEDKMLKIIPELSIMKNFSQNKEDSKNKM